METYKQTKSDISQKALLTEKETVMPMCGWRFLQPPQPRAPKTLCIHTNYLISILNGLPWAASHGWTARCLIQHSAQQSPELLLPPEGTGWGYIRSAPARARCPAGTRCCSSLPLLVTTALDQTSLGSLWQTREDTCSGSEWPGLLSVLRGCGLQTLWSV